MYLINHIPVVEPYAELKNGSRMIPSEFHPLSPKPYLSDAIDFARDIAPHRWISIWAGVGAGKSSLAEELISGRPEKGIPAMTVLIITSRKAKVVETLSRKSLEITNIFGDDGTIHDIEENTFSNPEDFKKIVTDCYGLEHEVYQRSAICTNAYIEAYLKYCYNPCDPTTHLWNRFDVIIWDEAHALCTDSSYQSAPYHVFNLIYEALRRIRQADDNEKLPEHERNPDIQRPTCKHIILMTGTPESIQEIPMIEQSYKLDLREACRSVTPKNIHPVNTRQAEQLIREQLQQGERIVYFSNHTPFPDILSEKYEIERERIAVSFSNENKRKQLEEQSKIDSQQDVHPHDYRRMVAAENYLAEHSRIPQDISLFVTTSRNKEGININDEDIRHVYIESHSLTDIKQMAGRLRRGAEHVYIIIDSPGYRDEEGFYETVISKQFGRPRKGDDPYVDCKDSQANINWKEFCQEQGMHNLASNPDCPVKAYDKNHPEIGRYIDSVKSKFPYFEYNHLKNEFHYNSYREKSRKFGAREWAEFNSAAKDPETLSVVLQKAFPESHIHSYFPPEEQGETLARQFLEQTKVEMDNYTIEELTLLLRELEKVFGKPGRSRGVRGDRISNPNYYLHKAGYHCKRLNNNPRHPNYNKYKIEIWNGKKAIRKDTA